MAGNKNSGNRTGLPRKGVSRPQSQARKSGRPFTARYLDDRGMFDRSSLSKTNTINKGLELLGLLALHASNGDVTAIHCLSSIGLHVVEDRLYPLGTRLG